MKTFSQFNNLIESKGDEVIPANVKKGEAFKKKITKLLKQTVPTKDADPWDDKNFDEIERDAKGKKGEEIRKTVEKQSDQLDKKVNNSTKGQNKLLDRVNDPNKNRPPNVKKGELGKLYKSGSDEYGYEGVKNNRQGSTRTNSKINQELQAKRTARIDPKTGKATQKGVENFAINKLTKGLSTKGPTGREQLANAKKLASNPSSPAYKKIESDINTSDYAGKRANLASSDELKKIKSDIKTSKTIDAKVDTGRGSKAPTNIKTKTTKIALNTSTRKGKIIPPKGLSTSTPSARTISPDWEKVKDGVKSNTSTSTPTPKTSTIQMGAKGGKPYSEFIKTAKKTKPASAIKNLGGKALGTGFVAWNAIDNYNAARAQGRSVAGSLVKSAVTTGAYYGGATAGAAIAAPIPVPGARIVGGLAGGNTASNVATKTYDKLFKVKKKDKKVGGAIPGGTGKKKGYTWSSGIAIESGPKK